MKNYIKPTFTLAGLFPVALAGNACTVPLKDYEDVCDIYGADPSTAFAMGDECEVELPIDGVCKNSLADDGTAATVIGS